MTRKKVVLKERDTEDKTTSHKKELLLIGGIIIIFFSFSTLKSAILSKKMVVTPQWVTYNSKVASYSASFPRKPEQTNIEIALGGTGKIEEWIALRSRSQDKTFVVSTVEAPIDYPLNNNPDSLEQLAKLAITLESPNSSVNPISEKFFEYQGVPAIEYEYKSEGGEFFSRFRTFYVGRTIYSIGEKAKKNDFSDYNKFINSLQISK